MLYLFMAVNHLSWVDFFKRRKPQKRRVAAVIPYKTTQAGIGGNLFLSPLHGIILTIFENAKNGRKKTGNLFFISCLGVPFHVAAVIQFTYKPDFICPGVVSFRNYSK